MRDFYTTIDEQMDVFRVDISYRASGRIRLHAHKTKFNNNNIGKKKSGKKKGTGKELRKQRNLFRFFPAIGTLYLARTKQGDRQYLTVSDTTSK